MGSVSNSVTSTANTLTNTPVTSSNSGSSSNTTGIFTGTSAYSQDLQNLISRAVAIADLPIGIMTNDQTALTSQATELTTMDTDFTALQNAVQGISDALGGASFTGTSTEPTAVTATLADGATEGSYSIKVDNAGAYATSLSTATWNTTSTLATGKTATYGLVVGNQEYSVTTSDNSAAGVAAAIQAQYSNLVNAVAVNVSSTDARISLQSTTLGPVNLDLIQVPPATAPTSLQTQNATGYAISQSTSTWVGPADTLVVNGNSCAIAPASSSAQDVVAAINSAAADNSLAVSASVVNVGTSAAPDNRIQLAGTTAGAMTLDIQDGSGPGMQTQEMPAHSLSSATWSGAPDAPGTQSQYTLAVGSSIYNVVAADNSAQTLAAAINSQYGKLVNATVVDLTGSGDYRIALQNKTLTQPAPTLNLQKSLATVPVSLQQQSATGYPVSQTTSTWAGAAGSYSLQVNGVSYALTPATTSAQDVAAAINTAAASHNLAVNAAAVNVGTSAAPDYRIQLEGTTPGFVSLGIQNGSGPDLQTDEIMATSRSAATWNAAADAPGTRSQYTLVVGSKTYNFVTADNSAQTVAAAINSQFGSLVNATVVDATGNGDYRIALQDRTGANPTMNIQKTADTRLQTSQTTGALAVYELDGAPQTTSNSPNIAVAPGVTLNLLGLTGGTAGPTTGPAALVTVTMSATALSSALSTFATAYNTCVDEVVKQRGTNAGPLQGSPILTNLSEALSSMATYSSTSGDVNTLKGLGLSLSENTIDGHLTFDGGLSVMGLNFGDSAGLTSFLGSATGGGFLGSLTTTLNNLENPTSGLLKTTEADVQTQITNIGTRITAKQNQVNQMQTQLTSQMAAADAAIASMEQQYSYISQMFQAQQTSNQSYARG
jgi:flagellar hook-associated protein 2